ncbi:DUF1902 domain-containing protein [Serratia fonticola]
MALMIYTAHFGKSEVRYVLVNKDLFVSKEDIVRNLKECATDYVRPVIDVMVEKWLQMACDMSDSRGAVIGDSSIGPVIHFHAVGNMLDALSGFNDAPNDEMRETGYRIHAFFMWYAEATSSANEAFDIGIGGMITSVKKRLDKINPAFTVKVYHDSDAWIAENDELGLVTEADTYEELTSKVWEIAPELYELNGIGADANGMRISFVQEQSFDDRMAL